MMTLRLHDARVDGRLNDVSLQIKAGLTVIVGENGAGKSTLLDVLAGVLVLDGGAVWMEDGGVDGGARDVASLAPRERAQHIASLGQESIDIDTTALERIAQGLAPRRGSGALIDDIARARVLAASRALGVDGLLERDVDALSAGQRRRVEVARALVDTGAACVIVDEPHAAVDLKHQGLVSRALVERAHAGTLVIVSVHDLGLAASIADRVIGLREGCVVIDGPPTEAITPAAVEKLYGVSGAVVVRDGTAVAVILPR
jgi:iron complex transport system ATP-binding protein